MPDDDEPIKIAAYLIHAHGHEVAMDVVMRGIAKSHDQGDGYRLSVWREVKKIVAAEADKAAEDEED